MRHAIAILLAAVLVGCKSGKEQVTYAEALCPGKAGAALSECLWQWEERASVACINAESAPWCVNQMMRDYARRRLS